MRFKTVLCVALASLLVHCGDSPTEPMVERNLPSFATTTTEDGLSISTDKDDYQPGDVVHFTGYGWQPFDVLDIVLTDDPQTHEPHTWAVSVGADGMFHDSTYVVDEGDLNVSFTLVATSTLTGRSLTVNFTDNINQASVTLNNLASVTVSPGATISLAVTARVTTSQSPTNWNSTGWILLPAPANTEPAGKLANCVNTDNVAGTSGNGTTATRTFDITAPTTPGTYDLWIAFSDVDNGGNTACGGGGSTVKVRFRNTVTVQAPVDQTRPTVTINQAAGQADPTNASPINFTVVFSETVTDFATGDVTLTGAGSSGATATVTGSGTTYTVAVSGMTTTGPVSASLAANVAHDAAGNGNEASTSTDNTVLYDKDGPKVTINQKSDQRDPTNQSPILFTVIFDKPVNDFVGTDVTLGGTAHPSTAVVSGGSDGMNYEVAVSGMTGDGTVTATIPADVAHDAAGNGNMAASSTDNEVTYDATSPTVTINQATGQADPTNTSPINFTVVFSEPVSGFQSNDILLSGTANPATAVVSTTDPDLKTYNVAVTGMTGDGTVIASVRVNAADDEATNHSAASTSTDNTVTYDKTPPTVTINQAAGQADPTSGSTINFTVVFSENVADFATDDVTLSGTANATTATVTGSGTTYNVAVTGMTDNGTVIASVGSGVAHDAAGNPNEASTSTDHTVNYDAAPPVVSNVAVDPDPTNGSIDVTATAKVDDAATGNSAITAAYYRIDNQAEVAMAAADGSFNSATENVTASIPAATVAALTEGNHQVCVRGTDQAGNSSSFSDAGACVTLRIDKQPPLVSNVTVSPNLTNGSIAVNATARVDDATTGNSRIVAAYYSIDGGAAVAMTAEDGSFSSATEDVKATIPASVVNALAEGSHTVCVQGKDVAGNLSSFSAAGACATLEIDKTPPEVTINQKNPGQADPTNESPINFTVVFTENVSDFATGDVTLSGTAGATTATVTGSGMSYNVAVSGMTGDGTVIASIASGKAHDAAGNGNNASTSTDNSVVYDKTPPVVSCGTADGAWHAGDVSITCTALDVTSGLKYPATDASFNLTTNVPPLSETDDASTNSRDIFDNAGNKATAGPIAGNKVDKKAPEVALTCPADPLILNATAVANWTASDGGSGISPDHGTVSLVTSSIGPKTASITVHDNVNNSNSSSCGYSVAYNFSGFFAPVDRPNTMNVSKVGQAIPLKWRLTDANGQPVANVTSVQVKAVTFSCSLGSTTDMVEEYATGSTGLQNLGDGYYQFNWKTPQDYLNSCKSIALVFGAGGGYTEKPSAYFTFKK
jgi:Bacterial Ig-like domain